MRRHFAATSFRRIVAPRHRARAASLVMLASNFVAPRQSAASRRDCARLPLAVLAACPSARFFGKRFPTDFPEICPPSFRHNRKFFQYSDESVFPGLNYSPWIALLH
ncbi:MULTISPECIES: hypothetical protein [Burkholderia]|uniref:hypothetical protein n=1 Tax=Burkholderia TaxID=32008 RepID=UPI000AD88FFA|nr:MULTISPECIES: hypothetical protein [Burkholderia]